MFDPKCEELARYFLRGRSVTEHQIQSLADEIQDVIEDWLFSEGLDA
jgi:hypothetical protein